MLEDWLLGSLSC